MVTQEDVISTGKKKLTQLKTWIEEMEVQMTLGRAEARDMMEKERKNFSEFIREQKMRLKKTEDEFEGAKNAMLEKFDRLDTRLDSRMAESKEDFDEQKRDILESVYDLERTMKEHYGEMAEGMQEQLDTFKSKLDGYRVQLALGKYEAEDKLQEKKAEMRMAIHDLRRRLQAEEINKLDLVSDELNNAVDHFRKAFKEVFK